MSVLGIYTFLVRNPLVGELCEGSRTEHLCNCHDSFFNAISAWWKESKICSFPIISLKTNLENWKRQDLLWVILTTDKILLVVELARSSPFQVSSSVACVSVCLAVRVEKGKKGEENYSFSWHNKALIILAWSRFYLSLWAFHRFSFITKVEVLSHLVTTHSSCHHLGVDFH